MKCDICYDSKRVKLPTHSEVSVISGDGGRDDFTLLPADVGWKEFDCPQCVPKVPYRRVRALKVATKYEAEQFARYQMPIQRGLAARFGEYLLREGLIRFSTSGSTDNGNYSDQITITAHLGVVSRSNTEKTEAAAEVAMTAPPPVPRKLTRQERERVKITSGEAVVWKPLAAWPDETEDVTDEFDEPKDAIANRFSGLEI